MRIRPLLKSLGFTLLRATMVVLLTTLMGASVISFQDQQAQIRYFTRPVEFDFLDWTVAATISKIGQWSLGTTNYMTRDARIELVESYLLELEETQRLQTRAEELFGNPDRSEAEAELDAVLMELDRQRSGLQRLRPVAETVLQEEVGVVLQAMDFSVLGAPLPPVLMRFTPLPTAFIVSPRDEIRQEANISLRVGLTLEEQIALERHVESALDVSTLIVPIGGMGTYPTMIQQSTALPWITEVIGHEWTHNYLTLHPLGVNYAQTPELRTMNETTASLMGVEFSERVLGRTFPEYLPPAETSIPVEPPVEPAQENLFDFRAEMRVTRLRVDDLLAEGEINAAEEYMEARRAIFWEHGYHIRKLNQAYFAFHGAYADEPGGAAGDDPVGAAVRSIWETVGSPADFLRLMASMDSYEELEKARRSLFTTR